MRRRNKGAAREFAAHDAAFCGFPREGMGLARRVLVTWRAYGAAVGHRETFHEIAVLGRNKRKAVRFAAPSGSVKRRNNGLPVGFAAYGMAFCGFTREGMTLALGVYVSQGAFYGASWYEKTALLEIKPASSSGFFAHPSGETRARTSEGRPMEWLLWVRLGALII